MKIAELLPESRLLHNNTCRTLLMVAREMLNGEIEYRKGGYDLALVRFVSSTV